MPIYLKIDGLTGDVSSGKYKGYMTISTYSWGFHAPVQTSGGSLGSRQTPGTVQVGELNITKTQDTTTPDLMIKAFGGKMFGKATMSIVMNRDGKEVEMTKYDMDDVILSSFTTGGHDQGGNPSESLSLAFNKMNIHQETADATGSPTKKVAGWKFGENTSL
jgi:type VI secretion system secreted protein Hcp